MGVELRRRPIRYLHSALVREIVTGTHAGASDLANRLKPAKVGLRSLILRVQLKRVLKGLPRGRFVPGMNL